MDESLISETLDALSDERTARKTRQHVHTLRGIRGTPQGEIARIAAAAWQESRPGLDDEDALRRLFASAWEDGLVAIGLLASMVPDHPGEVLEIAEDWLERVDDTATADALGWLVLGPALAATGADPTVITERATAAKGRHTAVRRATVAMGLAWLPIPLQGPAVAPLRERLSNKHLQFVDEPRSPLVHALCHGFLRDEDASVRKALRRLIREWVRHDPAAVVTWVDSVRGGLPKMLSAETRRAAARAARLAREA